MTDQITHGDVTGLLAGLHCPPWCTENHYAAAAEGNEEVRHYSVALDGVAHVLRNHVSGEVVRDTGGSWDMTIFQQVRADGHGSPAWLDFSLTGHDGRTGIGLSLSGGEARAMAAQLMALADKMDLEP